MTGPEPITPVTESAATQTGAPLFGTLPESTELTSSPATSPVIPGYELLGELGRGGMGVVFKARQIKLNRLVAIKMLPAGWHNDRELETRFRTEAEAVARLQHPNIVQIFEVGEAAGRPFLALEFVPGGTLAQFLARRPQDPQLAAQVTESLARAVHHAHTQGILHRDLKPGNILLMGGGGASGESTTTSTTPHSPLTIHHPKIADFGLAKHLNSSDGPTQVGDVLGTPSYMAPEQASGVATRLTAAVDIYALGAILYEMLTGRPPFLGATPTETVVQVLAQEPVAPRDLRPDCPRDLQTICLKCLEKNPSKRYPTAEALADDLRCYAAGEPITARPAGPGERLVKWARRRPGAASAIGIGALALILVLLLSAGFNFRLSQKNESLSNANQRERESARRAKANFEKARQVVKDLLAEVAVKDLESVPQMDPVRRSLLQKALKAQQEFLAQEGDDPEVLRELARAHDDVGEIYVMLGDFAAAEKHHTEAADLLRRLGDAPEVRLEIARVLMNRASARLRAGNHADAELDYVRAGEEAARVSAADPESVEAVYVRNRVRLNYGQLFNATGRRMMARVEFMHARDELTDLAARYPERTEFSERLGRALNLLGSVFSNEQHYLAALPNFLEARRLFLDLARKHPDWREYRYLFAVSSVDAGYAFWWQSKYDDADIHYEHAEREYRRLVVDHPHVPDYRHGLARTLETRGEMHDYNGQADGREMLDEALRIKLQLVKDQPQNPNYLMSVGVTYTYLSVSAYRHKRPIEKMAFEFAGMRTFERAIAARAAPARAREFLADCVWRFGQSVFPLIPPAWTRR